VIARVELTGMIDVVTRTATAAVLRPTTKSVDASVLLARTLTPEPMRPGWAEALRMSRSVLPHQRLLSIDERLEHAAGLPETIVGDHGKVFISHNFRASCRFLGSTSNPPMKGPRPTSRTSNGCWARWPASLVSARQVSHNQVSAGHGF
jgi:hypothetical protein